MKKVLIILLAVILSGKMLFAGEGHEMPFFNKYLWFSIINFIIFAGLLFYLLKKPVLDFFSNRKKEMEKEMEDSAKLLENAEKEREKYSELLDNLDKKIEELKNIAKSTAEREQQNIIKASEEYASKIKSEAEKIASQEVEKAIFMLKEEATELAIKIAENDIKNKINKDINERLISEVINKIEVN